MGIRGTVPYCGQLDEYEAYIRLALAIIQRAYLDAQLQPDRYKSGWMRRELTQARDSAIEFLAWGQALAEGDSGNGQLEHSRAAT